MRVSIPLSYKYELVGKWGDALDCTTREPLIGLVPVDDPDSAQLFSAQQLSVLVDGLCGENVSPLRECAVAALRGYPSEPEEFTL